MPPSKQSSSATVLVVDDNEANRALVESTLEDEGYRVVAAIGGAEGVDAFAREGPDCVLLDVRMPGVDGLAACERMRALPRGPETPILFLTASRDVDTFDRALQAGADDFLTKPIRPNELIVRVESAIKLRALRVELREHYELLKNQRDQLLRLQFQKERLTAFVVHDLKNPVNSMDLHAQFLLRAPGLSDAARESATQIRTDARQLTRMILNLLDLSKADEGQLAPKLADVDLRALLGEVAAEMGVNARSREVELRVSAEAHGLRADEDLLRRMVTNLVENAIRYAPPRTVVSLASVHAGAATEIRIADAGAGVPAEMREKVFSPFVQVEAGDRVVSRSGRGLGLAFCKLVVEAHGGRIGIEDASPGTVFCASFPDAH